MGILNKTLFTGILRLLHRAVALKKMGRRYKRFAMIKILGNSRGILGGGLKTNKRD
ncbi:MAG: hypothetical protein JHC80_08605 [Polynucleobacter sp.]|jgi:hypothetical protein|nr:hypothetical protein [Polynucleobacter sp.]